MALPEAFLKKRMILQAKNDLPVFLKGGPMDKVLFGITVGLCGFGILGMLQMAYEMGFKKKNN